MNKEHKKEYSKRYRLANKEKIREYNAGNRQKTREYNKIYRLANKEKIKETGKRYYAANKEKLKQNQKTYRLTNKEYYKEQGRRYRLANKEKIAAQKKKYYQCNKQRFKERKRRNGKIYRLANKEKLAARGKRYYAANKEKIAKYHKKYKAGNRKKINKYERQKLQNDPGYKLLKYIRRRVCSVMKGKSKCASTMKLLGCSKQELREHFESQFTLGMNWKNHRPDGWHIDHIIPCAAFDMTDPEQQRKCWNYKNLQPLWANENLSKAARILQRTFSVTS